MRKSLIGVLAAAALLGAAHQAAAAEAASCKTIKFSDVGWTDITATTAITTEIFKGLGYTPKINVLSVPVTYASMKNKDIDVFLGNWQPSMENDRKPYVEDKSVVVIGGRKWWWPTEERHLANILRRDGHRVILPSSKQ